MRTFDCGGTVGIQLAGSEKMATLISADDSRSCATRGWGKLQRRHRTCERILSQIAFSFFNFKPS